jgi:hypothetical protein
VLPAEVLRESGSGLLVVLVPMVLLGIGALIGSLWTRSRAQRK